MDKNFPKEWVALSDKIRILMLEMQFSKRLWKPSDFQTMKNFQKQLKPLKPSKWSDFKF